MSTRRQRSRVHRAPILTGGSAARPRRVLDFRPLQQLRRDRTLELCDLTRSEADRRHLEEVGPLLALVVDVDRQRAPLGLTGHNRALLAAVRIAGPCPAGWCRYPNGHDGPCEPLEAA